mmetsp:Transcript_27401/g.92221  ORF Transcript_27401/g.92221 Transcript_27401/m.92221 type:complete len:319 (+) Transcript_27401:1187-2143(+)
MHIPSRCRNLPDQVGCSEERRCEIGNGAQAIGSDNGPGTDEAGPRGAGEAWTPAAADDGLPRGCWLARRLLVNDVGLDGSDCGAVENERLWKVGVANRGSDSLAKVHHSERVEACLHERHVVPHGCSEQVGRDRIERGTNVNLSRGALLRCTLQQLRELLGQLAVETAAAAGGAAARRHLLLRDLIVYEARDFADRRVLKDEGLWQLDVRVLLGQASAELSAGERVQARLHQRCVFTGGGTEKLRGDRIHFGRHLLQRGRRRAAASPGQLRQQRRKRPGIAASEGGCRRLGGGRRWRRHRAVVERRGRPKLIGAESTA